MDFHRMPHPIIKHTTMTNKEILQASVLDIVFEHRNKEYGAYALRKGYDKRLLVSLAAALSLIVLFALFSGLKRNTASVSTVTEKKETVVLHEVVLLPEKKKEPEQVQKPKPPAAPKVASRQYVSKIVIKPDADVKKVLPDMRDLADKKIDDKNVDGRPDDGITKPVDKKEPETGNGNAGPSAPAPDFNAIEKQPEFPGGEEALRRFLASNLQSPSELESGEKKVVRIRFKVDKDGSVNTFEIVTSGGDEYDREVVRVFKKMPRWKPALQNGMNVPVSYMMPVTFIGME